ncbi:MAG: long-chain fatty acid--CoA ligase, partial [Proteobacteria bacterium]
LYPNSTTKDIHYILGHSEAEVLAVQNAEYFAKVTAGGAKIPERVRLILSFDGDTSFSPIAISYEKAISEGKRIAHGRKLEELLDRLDPKEPSFMIYTSGTTGNPKGALLCQDNLAFTADIIKRRWKLPEVGSLFSFLPLSHIAEKLHSVAVGISSRYVTSYCSKFENVGKELPEVEPTLLLCVPRVWEKMMEGVLHKLERAEEPKKSLIAWALGVGERVARAKYAGKTPSLVDLLAHPVADRVALSKIRQALGLGKAEVMASGAAPLPAHVARWFRNIGLEILEDYGSTETTGVVATTMRGMECAGTVGKPLEGCEFQLAHDGEILTRGRHVFLGYLNDPKNTADALKDGWYYTGDLGQWTQSGLLRISGRKKEIMKTSGGKMIAPSPIEEKLKAVPFISQVCLV